MSAKILLNLTLDTQDELNSIKSRRLCFTLLALIVGIPAVAVAWSIYRDLNPRPHYYGIDPSAKLTEELAIQFTRQALVDDDKATAKMVPEPYWPDSQFENPEEAERLFARNRIDSNSGYVIWSVGYHVRIEREGAQIVCRVYKPK